MLPVLGCLVGWIAPCADSEEQFGAELVTIDDWDGDACGDLLVGDWTARRGGGNSEPAAWVISSRSGELLDVIGLGWTYASACRIADIDGDGSSEFALLVERDRALRLILHSCAKRVVLLDQLLDPSASAAGAHVLPWTGEGWTGVGIVQTSFGDLAPHSLRVSAFDSKGRLRSVSRALLSDAWTPIEGSAALVIARDETACSATIFDRFDSSGLHRIGELDLGGRIIEALAAPTDLDGDGVVDVVVSLFESQRESAVWWLSGTNGTRLAEFGPFRDLANDTHTRAVGDLDGDGRADVVVTRPAFWEPQGYWSISTKTRETLWNHATPIIDGSDWNESRFGWSLAQLDDLDQDGCPDFAISTCNPWAADELDAVRIFSGRTGSLLRKLVRPWSADRRD